MKNSRAKGASAEREVFKIISAGLGFPVERNLEQTRAGGADTTVGRWAIEVKRQEVTLLNSWWQQAVEQAQRLNKSPLASGHAAVPMLIYRRSRMPWRAIVFVADLVESFQGTVIRKELAEETVEITLRMAIRLMRT